MAEGFDCATSAQWCHLPSAMSAAEPVAKSLSERDRLCQKPSAEVCTPRRRQLPGLYSAQEKKIAQGKANTEVLHERLRSAGPRQVLERGYSIVLKNDKPISSVRQAKENLTVIFRDGCAEVRVLSQKEVDPFAR